MRENKPFSVLVTAGGTREDIDTVRSITNHSTGRLGAAIAEEFYKNGAEVTFLCGEILADINPCAHKIIRIRSTAQLAEKIEDLLTNNAYDCVIHSMAVSDYTPVAAAGIDELVKAIRCEIYKAELTEQETDECIKKAILGFAGETEEKKISSNFSHMALILKQTPKVIGLIKKICPDIMLVGFKLLSGVSEKELNEAAFKLIKSCGCDFVVANDLNDISENTHKAVLIDSGGIIDRASTKKDIAHIIYKNCKERM